jgi:hypothetical protein
LHKRESICSDSFLIINDGLVRPTLSFLGGSLICRGFLLQGVLSLDKGVAAEVEEEEVFEVLESAKEDD